MQRYIIGRNHQKKNQQKAKIIQRKEGLTNKKHRVEVCFRLCVFVFAVQIQTGILSIRF